MVKIPTLFERDYFDNHKAIAKNEVKKGFEWVLEGDGIATVKWDGACCAVIEGIFYKRYDAKRGKKPPKDAIPCQPEPDAITGHWSHWVSIKESESGDKWFLSAYKNTPEYADKGISVGIFRHIVDNLTYEAVGPHFQSNPHNLEKDILIAHGMDIIDLPDYSFEGIKKYLEKTPIEGVVFWKDGIPQCKIKRKDFGFVWPIKEGKRSVNSCCSV